MRFSVKGLLGLIAYLSLALAAIARPHWTTSELMRFLSVAAIVFASLQSVYFRGAAQARSLGFAMCAGLHLYCIYNYSYQSFGAVAVRAITGVDEGMAPMVSGSESTRLGLKIRAADAVSTMAAGAIGYCLGALVFWRREEQRSREIKGETSSQER